MANDLVTSTRSRLLDFLCTRRYTWKPSHLQPSTETISAAAADRCRLPRFDPVWTEPLIARTERTAAPPPLPPTSSLARQTPRQPENPHTHSFSGPCGPNRAQAAFLAVVTLPHRLVACWLVAPPRQFLYTDQVGGYRAPHPHTPRASYGPAWSTHFTFISVSVSFSFLFSFFFSVSFFVFVSFMFIFFLLKFKNFKSKICSNLKNVQIWKFFKFKKCSNWKIIQILNLFIFKKRSIFENCLI
jgi:hypothetical protein